MELYKFTYVYSHELEDIYVVAKEDYNESHCPLRKFEKDYEDYRLECKCSSSQKLDDYYLYQARKELEDERNND